MMSDSNPHPSNVICRKYEPDDNKGLSELFKTVLGFSVNTAYWSWKFLENPLATHATYVTTSDNKIVGIVGCIPYRVFIHGKEYIGAHSVDFLVHPKWRSKKTFLTLNRMSLEEIRKTTNFHFGLANPTSYKIYSKLFHYNISESIFSYKKLLNITPFLKNRPGQFAGKLVNFFLTLSLLKKFQSEKGYFEQVTSFDIRFDDLWERVRNSMSFCIVRDSRYLQWRFGTHPLYSYTTYALTTGTRLEGYVVLTHREIEGIKRGFIVDILWEPEWAIELLIAKSIQYFLEKDVNVVCCWSLHAMNRILRKYLFIRRPTETTFLSSPLHFTTTSDDPIATAQRRYLMMGDCDSI